MIRLVASDLDGTLFDELGQPTPDTFSLIRELRANGIRFCVSSGRRYAGLVETFAPVLTEMDFVASNGGEVYVGGTMIGREVFSHDAILVLERVVNQFDQVHLAVADRQHTYICDPTPEKFQRYADRAGEFASSLINAIPGPEANIVSGWINCDDPAMMDDMAYVFGLECGRLFNFSYTSVAIDFMPLHVSKATGIRKVMQHYGVSHDETRAYGDAMNDYEIMRMVGHPIAVGNAMYGVSRIAERVVGTNVEHGVQRDLRALLDEVEEGVPA